MEILLQICGKNYICVDTTYTFSITLKCDTREELRRWTNDIWIRHKVIVIITRSDTDDATRSTAKKCCYLFKIRLTSSKDGSGW